MKLVWNDCEMGWICSECGAIYGPEEVARAFNDENQTQESFNECYCMDCGGIFTEAVKE